LLLVAGIVLLILGLVSSSMKESGILARAIAFEPQKSKEKPLFRRFLLARVQIPLAPPLVNNTNSENGFVLFFAIDYFGIIVERK
jgi:hypothetical protein